ncbi:hypothetical protein NPIL_35741 [Nephila pilipes]|uniref:Uncharacterized protein n=1 Tax=Nephila pilipes TaxID=299642 RepID=A0A8X6QVX2_NEPPI|nr:hypothetical protein NPIL_35741 [Nephila pilipes]
MTLPFKPAINRFEFPLQAVRCPKHGTENFPQKGEHEKGATKQRPISRARSRDECEGMHHPWNTESKGSCGCVATTSSSTAAPSGRLELSALQYFPNSHPSDSIPILIQFSRIFWDARGCVFLCLKNRMIVF